VIALLDLLSLLQSVHCELATLERNGGAFALVGIRVDVGRYIALALGGLHAAGYTEAT